MLQLRTYILRSAEAAQRYSTVHWARHLSTFAGYGVRTLGVWAERGTDARRVMALISYPPGADPDQLTRHIMASTEFASDMDGFDVADIVDVHTTLLDPTPFSPIH